MLIKIKSYFLFSLVLVLAIFNIKGVNAITFSEDKNFTSREALPAYTAQTFSEEVYSSEIDGDVNITLDRDIDLSDFSSSTLNTTDKDNAFAIHGLNNVTIDFNGHKAYDKSYQFQVISDALVEIPNNYEGAAEMLYEGDWGQTTSGTNDNASFYYVYWFYDIENLTILNANIESVPFFAYDIDNLIIKDSIFTNTEVSGVYFARYGWSVTSISSFKHMIGVVADQITNLTLENVLFEGYTIKQNIFNYANPGGLGKAKGEIGLFTRIGFDSSSIININNVAFDNIDISLNERGVSANPDGEMDYGILVGLKGQISLQDVYYNEILFFNNNDQNTNGTRQNSLISVVSDHSSRDPDAANSSLKIENVFVGNVFTTAPDTTLVAANAYEYNDYFVSEEVKPASLTIAEGYSNVITTTYSEEEQSEIFVNGGYSTSLVNLNTFLDEESISNDSFENISSNDYFDKNFNSDYYIKQTDDLPTPIDSVIVGSVSHSNRWKNLEVTLKFKTGFYQYNSEPIKISLNNTTTGDEVYSETIDYTGQDDFEFAYSKSTGERLNRYSISVYSPSNDDYLLNNFALLKATFPIWLIILIILLFLLLALIILSIALLLLKKKNETGMALATEANELAIQMYDYQYDLDNIDAYYEYLNVSKNINLKKAHKLQNQNIIDYQKGIYSKEEFENRQLSIIAIIEYIERGGE